MLVELMDKALEEKSNALRKVGLMSWERKIGEKSMAKTNRGFTRWEKGGNREGESSKSVESEGNEKKVVEGGRLSQAELRERSRKGLCFKCGETLGQDHVCKLKHYKFVLVEQSKGEETESSEGEEEKN